MGFWCTHRLQQRAGAAATCYVCSNRSCCCLGCWHQLLFLGVLVSSAWLQPCDVAVRGLVHSCCLQTDARFLCCWCLCCCVAAHLTGMLAPCQAVSSLLCARLAAGTRCCCWTRSTRWATTTGGGGVWGGGGGGGFEDEGGWVGNVMSCRAVGLVNVRGQAGFVGAAHMWLPGTRVGVLCGRFEWSYTCRLC
jgi:hypothetical protein